MTRFALSAIVFASFVALGACKSGSAELAITASGSPLTDQGADALFTVAIVDAPEEGWEGSSVKVRVTPPDAPAIDASCTVEDVNANQKVDAGDRLVCVEGASNQLGAALAGKEMSVEVLATKEGKEETIGEGVWTAPK